jgi:hypothetical protein
LERKLKVLILSRDVFPLHRSRAAEQLAQSGAATGFRQIVSSANKIRWIVAR